MHQPPFLLPPQTIGVVAPAAPVLWQDQDLKCWHDRGYTLRLPHLDRPWHYLSGTDRERFADFATSWSQYGALLCGRGGYGTMRLLPWLDELGAERPWVIGFSDITALLWALATTREIMTIHAPVLFTCATAHPLPLGKLFDLLEGKLDHLTLPGMPWRAGKATGRLLPGNLTVATHLLGTPYIPPWEEIILALEDVGEPPYKIDRMLTQWHLAGQFKRVRGIALGSFGADPLLDIVLQERLHPLGIPIVGGLPFGHSPANYPLVVGAPCVLDGDNGTLTWYLEEKLG